MQEHLNNCFQRKLNAGIREKVTHDPKNSKKEKKDISLFESLTITI